MVDFTQLNDLTIGSEASSLPTKVKGRVVHIDADIMAYEIAANCAWMDSKYRRNAIHKECIAYVNGIVYSSGAESAVCYTTPKGSTKGNRFNQALLKVYQGNRKDKAKPADLDYVREYLGNPNHARWVGVPCMEYEADDAMAMAMYESRKIDPNRDVICSLDKDLRMIEGWHLDWNTHELQQVSKLGCLYEQDKKIKGNGMMWFFFQMLRGDTADNISGIPKVSEKFLQEYVLHTDKAMKPKLCGEKMAYNILKDITSVEEAFNLVATAYRMYGEEIGFKDYAGNDITAKQAFLSEAYLLWMRETDREQDYNRWIHESGNLNTFKEIFYD